MFRTLALSAAICLAALPAAAELIRKPSPHTVAETTDRLEAAVAEAGATVFARIDHAAGAESVGMELAPSQLLVFGNPQLGTPVMQADPAAGLDLPLRVLVMEGEDGTMLLYRAPASLAAEFDIPADAEVLQRIAGALDMLTSQAVATD